MQLVWQGGALCERLSSCPEAEGHGQCTKYIVGKRLSCHPKPHICGWQQLDDVEGDAGYKMAKSTKRDTSEHIAASLGCNAVNANKSRMNFDLEGKRKGSVVSHTVIPFVRQEEPSANGGTGDETRQAQGQVSVDRAVPGVSYGPSPRSVVDADATAHPGVAAVEPLSKNPDGRGSATGQGISSAVRIRGSVLEVAGRVKRRPIKVLIDSGATGNFISDQVVTALRLKVKPEGQFEELTLADGSVVKAAGYVQFKLDCGDYRGDITARVFPNLHKEIILGMPWLVQANPTIDWTNGRVTVEQDRTTLRLPLVQHRTTGPKIDSVNLCSAKQMARWFRRHQVDRAFVGIIRRAKTDDEQQTEAHVSETEEEKAFHANMPASIKAVLHEFKDVFPQDLPPGLPPVRMGHEFKIELEDDTPPVHRPIYKLSPLEL